MKGIDNRRDPHDCFLDFKNLNFSVGLDGDLGWFNLWGENHSLLTILLVHVVVPVSDQCLNSHEGEH